MSTDRARTLAGYAVYGTMALGAVAAIDRRSMGPLQLGCGLASILSGLVLLRRPDWSGRLLGSSVSFSLWVGLGFVLMSASTEHLVTGAAETAVGVLSIACILIGWRLDFRARTRSPGRAS
jgi:hypothetical protein